MPQFLMGEEILVALLIEEGHILFGMCEHATRSYWSELSKHNLILKSMFIPALFISEVRWQGVGCILQELAIFDKH